MTNPILPAWVQYVQALGPAVAALVAALLVAVIQHRQWKTAQDKVRVDLFDKRFSMYLAFREFLDSMHKAERWTTEDHYDLASKKAASKFLFGKDVAEIRSEMLKISIDLQPVLNVINAANVLYAPEKVEEANRQRDRLADRLLTVDLRLDRVFDAYLGLEKVRGY